MVPKQRVVKGYRSHFTQNKTALSQFTENMTFIGISRFTENKRECFGKSWFTVAMEIIIHAQGKK